MRFLKSGDRLKGEGLQDLSRKRQRFRWFPGCACLLVVAASLGTAGEPGPQSQPSLNKPLLLPEANRTPDAIDQMKMSEQSIKNKNFEAVNIERKRQITEESAMLLRLATELKAEVDKTSKDTLSLGIIHKADEIERLARGVKEKMKLTIGAN